MAGNEQREVVTIPSELTTSEQVRDFIQQEISRRTFTKAIGIAGLGAVAFQFGCSSDPKDVTPRQVYVANALGMVVADPNTCAGCRRCEAACTGYNLGKAQPSVSNVKVNRNLLYGVNATSATGLRGDGLYGNFRVVQDTCRQCPHPVPCQLACPNDAIEVIEPLNARVVNEEKCQGCGICLDACPWEMTSLDGPVNGAGTKSHKCTLCYDSLAAGQERPNCVEACITGALQYVAWADRTELVPPRHAGGVAPAQAVEDSCKQCH
jgi:Fe-S-cluster-containing dehydrogenase component